MKTLILGRDAQLAQEVTRQLGALDAALQFQFASDMADLSLCGLCIVIHADASQPYAESAPTTHAVRWLISACAADTASGFDAVIHWPWNAAQVSELLKSARTMLRSRGGIADKAVLDLALRRLAELASESIEVVDPSIRLLYCNPAFEEVTGWSMEDALGFSTGELFRAGTHDPQYYATIGAALRAGKIWRGPLVARRRDGVHSFQEATLAPVQDADGNTVAFVALKRDAERDSLARSAGASSGQRLQTMMEDAADAFFVHDRAGMIIDLNTSACHLLGRTRDELLAGRRIHEFVTPKDVVPMSALFHAVQAGEPSTFETRLHRDDGSATDVGMRVGAFSFGGEQFVLTLARDITARVALEAQLRAQSEQLSRSLQTLQHTQRELVSREKHAALGTLVAGVAHEVNTPLGVTLTALSLAQEHLGALKAAMLSQRPSRQAVMEQADELDKALSLCVANAQRAANLVKDFKKVAVDQASEVLREVELLAYLRTIVGNLSPQLRRAEIDVEVAGSAMEIITRPGAIAQIVTNLLQNAMVHAFDANQNTRKVRIECLAAEDLLLLTCADNGKGMTAESAARVFDPFFTTRMGAGGSGLGMAIVHNLVVEVLGGTVAIDTQPGAGFAVVMRLPLQRAAQRLHAA